MWFTQAPKRCFSPAVLAAFFLGCLVFFLVERSLEFMHCRSRFTLINPALPCGGSTPQGEWNYEGLRDVLLQKKEELKRTGQLSHLSIYFRDLTQGPRFGIGEYDKFQPASLVKLPVLIAILHQADFNPDLLDQTLTFTGAIKIDQNLENPEETIKPDTPYTIRSLLEKMIVYSDNFSSRILVEDLKTSPSMTTFDTFRDLDILKMMIAPKADYVSIQSYANLFAVLYNTGYLSKQMSQYALELLSRSTFNDALVAGVPPDVRVAHKFGYRLLSSRESQLHDCGIVYHPSTAYVLCVMTSGSHLDAEEAAIADVSSTVYDAVSVLSFRGASR